MTNRLSAINTSIDTLKAAERITKKELSFLSRELLTYVMIDAGTNDDNKARDLCDIDAVNRTISILTPMNKRTACIFFNKFLPFSFDEDNCTFGKMNKKQKDGAIKEIEAFLANEDNDIWSWAEANIKMEEKEIDYAGKITKAVEDAVSEQKGGMSVAQVLDAVLKVDGIDAGALFDMMKQPEAKPEAV